MGSTYPQLGHCDPLYSYPQLWDIRDSLAFPKSFPPQLLHLFPKFSALPVILLINMTTPTYSIYFIPLFYVLSANATIIVLPVSPMEPFAMGATRNLFLGGIGVCHIRCYSPATF